MVCVPVPRPRPAVERNREFFCRENMGKEFRPVPWSGAKRRAGDPSHLHGSSPELLCSRGWSVPRNSEMEKEAGILGHMEAKLRVMKD